MSVCIHIKDNYYLRSDQYQWIIAKELRVGKSGKPEFENLSFHTTATNAIESLIHRQLRDSNATTLHHLTEIAKSLRTQGLQALSALNETETLLKLEERK